MTNDTSSKPFHIYGVGMGSDLREIEAPSAGAAAIFYGVKCVNTNNPFMAAVYTEDGKDFTGEAFWMSIVPDDDHVKMVFERVSKEDVRACRIVDPAEAALKTAEGLRIVGAWLKLRSKKLEAEYDQF